MTSLADRTIAALHMESSTLAALAPELTDAQLTGPSGATDWSVAQVLSHLGSGAEITLTVLRGALGTASTPADDANQRVWDRWNAMSATEQRAAYLEHDAALLSALDELGPDQRSSLSLTVGFLPFPLDVATFAGMRLHEATHHGWDVRVAVDDTASLREDTARVLADQLGGGMSFLSGFIGKADVLDSPAVVDLAGSGYALTITDTVGLTSASSAPTAAFEGPFEAALRLIAGRLAPRHTPAGVRVSGNVSLDDLRRVFPGF